MGMACVVRGFSIQYCILTSITCLAPARGRERSHAWRRALARRPKRHSSSEQSSAHCAVTSRATLAAGSRAARRSSAPPTSATAPSRRLCDQSGCFLTGRRGARRGVSVRNAELVAIASFANSDTYFCRSQVRFYRPSSSSLSFEQIVRGRVSTQSRVRVAVRLAVPNEWADRAWGRECGGVHRSFWGVCTRIVQLGRQHAATQQQLGCAPALHPPTFDPWPHALREKRAR